MIYGYARVSTLEQNLDRQLYALKNYGVNYIYSEKVTGTKKNRPELVKMLNVISNEDTVVIADLTRISRSTKDLLDIIEKIKSKGACIKSIKDTWLDTTITNPYNEFLLVIMGGLSQLERDLIAQRTKEGKAIAKQNPNYHEGRNKTYSSIQIKHALDLLETHSYSQVASMTGISKSTLIRAKKG